MYSDQRSAVSCQLGGFFWDSSRSAPTADRSYAKNSQIGGPRDPNARVSGLQEWLARHGPRRFPRILAVGLCLVLLFSVACRKRTNQGTISAPPVAVVAAPEEIPEVEELPEPDEPEVVELPSTPEGSATPWLAADDLFRHQDLAGACSSYNDLRSVWGDTLPADVEARSVLSCAVGSPADRQRALLWLREIWARTQILQGDQMVLLVVERLLEQLRLEIRAVADRETRIEELNKELEELKKIDARRRRP